MFLNSFLTEAALFINTLKQRVDKKVGEQGRKYKRIPGSPLKTPPPEVASWVVSTIGEHQEDTFTDVESSPSCLTDTG